ncbi:3-dehydroquinate synthase [bacterium]|nr:3-dehydroquinate synthase [bacterium]
MKIKIELTENSYLIYVDYKLNKITNIFKENKYGNKILIVSDDNVFPLYGNLIKEGLSTMGKKVFEVILAPGEKTKTFNQLIKIIEVCGKNKMGRDDTILTLGGGVVSDIGGFASSIYMRGINFVTVPTTLLAQVDASVGGKTAVNLPFGKNLVGSFYQPSFVYIDLNTLDTLSNKEIKQGISEIIKYGIIKKKQIFDIMEKETVDIKQHYKFLVTESLKIKKDVVEKDEKEKRGLREILNFGHTLGHAIEISHFPKFTHGEAVALGMVGETFISSCIGLCGKDVFYKVKEVVKKWELPFSFKNIKLEEALEFLSYDKKVRQGKIRFVLPQSIGKVKTGVVLTIEEVENFLKDIG